MHASSKTAASSSARAGAGSRTAASTPRAFVKTAAAALPSNKTAAEAQPAAAHPLLRRAAASLLAAAVVATTLAGAAALAPPPLLPQAQAMLTAGDPVKNARALLRNALPIDNKPMRTIQAALEGVSEQLRVPGSKALGPVSRALKRASGTLASKRGEISAAFAPSKKAAGDAALDGLDKALKNFEAVLESGDKQQIPAAQQAALVFVTQAEEALVKGFPFEVPAKYASLPQLKGRATLEMKLTLKEARQDGVKGGLLTIVADGYNAPVTAGNFVDLAAKKFYDGMEIQRADGFVVQTGEPANDQGGYVENGKVRTIPFEVMVKGDKAPVYEETLEDLGRFNDQPAIPFNAYGTLAAARSEFEANSASSQVFWLLKESELTPSGANLLDGRYAVLGYVVDGADLLADVQVGDRIDYIKVVSGGELLVKGGGGSSTSAAAAAAAAAAAPTAAAAAEVAAAQ